MRDSAFLVHNTQQLLFSKSIIDQIGSSGRSVVIIVGVFKGAVGLYESLIANIKCFGGVQFLYFDTRRDVFDFIKSSTIRSIYIDSDVGFRNFVVLNSLRKAINGFSINVYEDGVGTYRVDLYGGLKKYIFDLIGVATHMGGFEHSERVFVMEPDEYIGKFRLARNRVVKIELSPYELIVRDIDIWNRIFPVVEEVIPASATCAVYLSTWHLEQGVLRDFLLCDCDRYIKLHPRLIEAASVPGVKYIGHNAPAELVLERLSHEYSSITVYHHGSSVERYVQSEKIEFIRI